MVSLLSFNLYEMRLNAMINQPSITTKPASRHLLAVVSLVGFTVLSGCVAPHNARCIVLPSAATLPSDKGLIGVEPLDGVEEADLEGWDVYACRPRPAGPAFEVLDEELAPDSDPAADPKPIGVELAAPHMN